MKASVILVPIIRKNIRKSDLGFSVQTTKDFEIIIADDGSREATKT